MTGATIARSSSAKITNTSTRIIGMIMFRSWSAALAMSRFTAVLPPTSAAAPGTAWTAVLTRSIVLKAAGLSGAVVSVPWK